MKLPMLYKQGNRGIEQWETWVEDSGTYATIIVEWGAHGGKLQQKRTTISKGKNIGKKNESTIIEQAKSECKSKWNKQHDKGYVENIDDIEEVAILPMLAHSFDKHSDKFKYPGFIQPKLDGGKCLASSERLWSRKNKTINSVPHIQDVVKLLPKNIILDGELFNPDVDFQEIMSIVRKDNPSDKSHLVQYHVYDCIDLDRPELTFAERTVLLKEIVKPLIGPSLVFVKTEQVFSEEDVNKFHELFISQGYEGSILRNAKGPYEIDKRSFHLLKLKDFQDEEFEIVGYSIDKNGHCVFSCKTSWNKEFDVKCEGDDAYRKQLAKDAQSYIGKLLTVTFFEYTTENGAKNVPRFPVGKAIRDYE